MAPTRQSMPISDPGFQVKVSDIFKLFPLRSAAEREPDLGGSVNRIPACGRVLPYAIQYELPLLKFDIGIMSSTLKRLRVMGLGIRPSVKSLRSSYTDLYIQSSYTGFYPWNGCGMQTELGRQPGTQRRGSRLAKMVHIRQSKPVSDPSE